MKKYLVHLLILTLVLAVVTLIMNVTSPAYRMVPWSVAYFAVVYGVSHYLVLNSMRKVDPRDFIKRFFGLSVGTMMLHLVVLLIFFFITKTREFIICFGALFLVYLIFETVELLLYVRKQKKLDKDKVKTQESEID